MEEREELGAGHDGVDEVTVALLESLDGLAARDRDLLQALVSTHTHASLDDEKDAPEP